jgi:hypothetical protein
VKRDHEREMIRLQQAKFAATKLNTDNHLSEHASATNAATQPMNKSQSAYNLNQHLNLFKK